MDSPGGTHCPMPAALRGWSRIIDRFLPEHVSVLSVGSGRNLPPNVRGVGMEFSAQ